MNKIKLFTSFVILCLVMTPALSFAQTLPSPIIASDITIRNPTLNGYVNSTAVTISGTYKSPTLLPTITVYVDGVSYATPATSTSSTTGTWSIPISVTNGWHTVKVTMSDGNGVISDSTNFFANDGATNIAQIKYPNVINVEYSEACKAMISRGDYSHCPPLKVLIPYDTSNQKYSGTFVLTKSGDYIRTKPQLINAYQYYTVPTTVVDGFIDANSLSQMQTVFVEPTGFSYTQHTFYNVISNNTGTNSTGGVTFSISTSNENSAGIVVYHDKWVTPDCMTAEVVFQDNNTIPKTIQYLKDGCKDPNFFNTTTTQLGNHPFSFDNPHSTLLYDNLLKSVFHGHKGFSSYNQTNAGGLGPSNCITVKCANPSLYNNFNNPMWSGKHK